VDWYESEVRELERERTRQGLPPHPAVFYGSSSIRLWTTLANDLGSKRAINLGFGGSTLAACVWFFDRLVAPTRPASLIVYAGENDLGDGRTRGEVVHWFGQLARKVKKELPGVPFGYISIKPSPARAALTDEIAGVNEAIRQEMTRQAGAFYIDVFTGMLHPSGTPRGDLFLADGLHLSRAGYELWAEVLGQYRDRMFTSSSPGRQADVPASDLDVS